MSSRRFAFSSALFVAAVGLVAMARPASATDLIMNGGTMTLGGQNNYGTVSLTNGAVINVPPYNGTDQLNTGNLIIHADSITIDATSRIIAKGAGYQGAVCLDGAGPSYDTAAGGRGGCAVFDSAGGGAHFGNGGRGTHDNPNNYGFPGGYEDACTPDGLSTTTANKCASYSDCRNYTTGLPSVAGVSYYHSIWATEFGAAGGDKGCRDGDGFDSFYAAGSGGGRIVLAAVNPGKTGSLSVAGLIRADGNRGCGAENDSGGGGAGGTVLLVGDAVTIASTAVISAKGGRGGDEQPKCLTCATNTDCGTGQTCTIPMGQTTGLCNPCNCTPCTTVGSTTGCPTGQTCTASTIGNVCEDGTGKCTAYDQTDNENECRGKQNSGTCDDCGGGGGGGGIINVKSRTQASISTDATFTVIGNVGGICAICAGEAGGGAGELQIDGGYTGELCDGYDNDFDGTIDDNLGNVSCGYGTCATSEAACTSGAPTACNPPTSEASNAMCECRGTSRPRITLLVDSSSSMLQNLNGTVTFGDGSLDHPGIDTNSNGLPDDSKMYAAKNAVAQLIAAYPEIDFALARYHQDELLNRTCQTGKWLECQSICCSYDDPKYQDPASATDCTLTLPLQPATAGNIVDTVHSDPLAKYATSRCVNYAGTCGSPQAGADILVGFESDVRQYMSWLDGGETNFNPDQTEGNYCGGLTGDCELRAQGPTPIAESLSAIYDYMLPFQACDPAAACRGYSVIFVSDGGEECGGTPAPVAAKLLAAGIKTYVLGLSVTATQGATLTAVASAGGTTDYIPVTDQTQLLPALVSIVSSSIHTELCNGIDDNCNGQIDEGFNVGAACDNGLLGVCKGTGVIACNPKDATSTICNITMPGKTATTEVCNGLDDNCNGQIDEGNPGGGVACGSTTGSCKPGVTKCEGGAIACVGATGGTPEICDGIDNDCNGVIDDCGGKANGCNGGECGTSVGECQPGMYVCEGTKGLVCTGGVQGTPEVCNGKDDDCDGIVDDNVPGTGVPCTMASDGSALCKAGVVRCIGGQLVCQGGVAYHAPSCTCAVDDCSLSSDGGAGTDGCPTGSACIACACRTPCAQGEFPCSGTQVCRSGFCVPPTCGATTCQSYQDCVNDTCVDQCTTKNIKCTAPLICAKGACVSNDCYGLGCAAGQVCHSATCVPDPCADKTCDTGSFCENGTCIKSCDDVFCPTGQVCANGACVTDPCNGSCQANQTCVSGACTTNNCTPSCETGQVCQGTTCIDDPCANVKCPGDPSLVTCQNGQCVAYTPPPAPPQPEKIVGAGGGGLSCSFTAGTAPTRGTTLWFFVPLLGLLLRRSRKKAVV